MYATFCVKNEGLYQYAHIPAYIKILEQRSHKWLDISECPLFWNQENIL